MLQSFYEFLGMGGYAFYVWGAYALAFVSLSLALGLPLYRHRQLRRKLKAAKVKHASLA